MQLTLSCSSSSNEIEPLKPEGEDTPLEKDEYTFMNVEYRKWQNGTFQAWQRQIQGKHVPLII